MKRAMTWRPPLWLVVVLMATTLALGTGAGYVQGASQGGECPKSEAICSEFATFWQVWDLAESRFLDPEAADADQMIAGAINGMLDTLDDQGHTRYNTPEEWARQQESLSGEFEGIGAYVGQEGGLPVIVAPIEGSPAEAAGIEAGDIILRINGERTEGMTIDEVVSRIRGEPGTDVTLTVQQLKRDGPIEITITRAQVQIPAITWRMLPGDVAHIRLSQFSEKAKPELQRALREAREQGAQSIIFDLRNNPGGLLEQAIGVASQFLPRDEVVLRVRDRDGNEQVYRANENNPETDLPIVVLINAGSASSSEIVSGALKDHNRATVIGGTTAGLGTVLTPFRLDNGGAVYLGTQEWLTPDGNEIRHLGVEPDIQVSLPTDAQPLTPSSARDMSDDEILESDDTQLLRGLEVLGVNTVALGPSPIFVR
jgi:carboxyl-terminal processing protease